MQRDKIIETLHARAPSPWDKFSTSPSPHSDGLEIEMRRSDGIPRLAPEVEQGNVEYKLILMNPTPERLQRLVTQLNWRLMEGNGEAYYQLGVADSGELIGLSKREMEATLETLENMAGELGASVIINREIEVRGHFNASLALESINGISGKDMNGMISSSSASSLSTSVVSENVATDPETSEAEAESEHDENAADSPTNSSPNGTTAVIGVEEDPDEIIVRSAPVPITPSFLRRQRDNNHAASRTKVKERTLMPQDFSPFTDIPRSLTIKDEDGDDDDELGVFGFSDLRGSLAAVSTSLDPNLPPKSKTSKPPKVAKQPKGAKPPIIPLATKTPEQVAQKLAERRAKRDKRREERRRALMDPVYDHANLVTQDGTSGGINYESIVREYDDHEQNMDDSGDQWNGTIASPSETLMSSLVTLKPDKDKAIITGVGDLEVESGSRKEAVSPAGDSGISEPRLIVEALVVRKAGFGRGYVDLSQFDSELAHLPSFSLS